jgi:hypothetical protein
VRIEYRRNASLQHNTHRENNRQEGQERGERGRRVRIDYWIDWSCHGGVMVSWCHGVLCVCGVVWCVLDTALHGCDDDRVVYILCVAWCALYESIELLLM